MFVRYLLTTSTLLALLLAAALLTSADGFVTSNNKVAFATIGHRSSPQPLALTLSRHAIRKESVIQKAEPENSLSNESSSASSSSSSPPKSSSSSPLDKPVLAVLDLVVLLVFAGIGKASHASDGSLDLLAIGITAFPFIVSWFATSFFTGVYGPIDDDDDEQWLQSSSFQQTLQGWIVAIPLGCVGRGLIKGYIPPAPFVIVTMVATLVMLGATRSAYQFVTSRTAEKEKEQAD
jgi:hypothetical protein